MNLIKAQLKGFRRFHDDTLDLNEDVVAIVGPNEAGKSSLLKALTSVENQDPFGSDITRDTHPPADHPIVRLVFALDDDERAHAEALGGAGLPRFYILTKQADGSLAHRLSDPYERDLAPRRTTREVLVRLVDERPPSTPDDDLVLPEVAEGEERPPALTQLFDKVVAELDTDRQSLSADTLDALTSIRSSAEALLEEAGTKVAERWLTDVREAADKLHAHEDEEHPRERLLSYLSGRRPRILDFDDEQRQLARAYGRDQLTNPPAALRNLLRLAEIDVGRLREAVEGDRHDVRYTLQEQGNRRLRERFGEAWRQSDVTPELQIDQEAVRIQVSTAQGEFTSLDERSDGLRTFVAMYAYTYLEAYETPPILLVDEAENHLHYDAQADLVRVFTDQQTVAKVVYTTHSAGCLPQDLGRGVRIARPMLDESGKDSGRSEVSNSFWTEGPGFSPLMLAMGASVLALVPTRYAVIAEGAADFILLPTLFRQALGVSRLRFQVAPGLAEVAPRMVESLSLEAPRVAYLVDGDQAGRGHASKLHQGGISRDRIVSLPKGATPEDLVSEAAYVEAVNAELRLSHGDDVQLEAGALKTTGRAGALDAWCESKSIDPPSKRRVADRLAGMGRQREVLDPRRRAALVQIHQRLSSLLDLEETST